MTATITVANVRNVRAQRHTLIDEVARTQARALATTGLDEDIANARRRHHVRISVAAIATFALPIGAHQLLPAVAPDGVVPTVAAAVVGIAVLGTLLVRSFAAHMALEDLERQRGALETTIGTLVHARHGELTNELIDDAGRDADELHDLLKSALKIV